MIIWEDVERQIREKFVIVNRAIGLVIAFEYNNLLYDRDRLRHASDSYRGECLGDWCSPGYLPGVDFINCFAPYAQLLRSFLEA